MQRQQDRYAASKATYQKASRGGLKVKEPPPPAAAVKPAGQSSSTQTKQAASTGSAGTFMFAVLS